MGYKNEGADFVAPAGFPLNIPVVGEQAGVNAPASFPPDQTLDLQVRLTPEKNISYRTIIAVIVKADGSLSPPAWQMMNDEKEGGYKWRNVDLSKQLTVEPGATTISLGKFRLDDLGMEPGDQLLYGEIVLPNDTFIFDGGIYLESGMQIVNMNTILAGYSVPASAI